MDYSNDNVKPIKLPMEEELISLLLKSNIDKKDACYELKVKNEFSAGLLVGDRWNQYKTYLKYKEFDALTGLPNLNHFKTIAKKLLLEHSEFQYVIVYSDLSRVKFFNDILGYDIGDKILCDLAKLFQEHLQEYECLARISEDNFLSLIRYDSIKELRKRILTINEQFNSIEKIKYPGNKFIIISGVAKIQDVNDINTVIENANIARKSVKDSLKAACKIFDEEMKKDLQKEAEITNDMEQALKNGEFLVFFQPKINLKTNELVGAEALVRWNRNGVLIPPNDFIPIFEKNGFIVNVDFYVYEVVCKTLQKWMHNNISIIPISINVSRVHLNDDDFVNQFEALVDYYGIPHNYLELELTETIVLDNPIAAIEVMKKLKYKGFSISIDDFGSGYSSLNLLKDINTDILKLDKEFFSKGEMKREEKIIVSSIIGMAKQLDMKVVSEGVETKIQSEFLKSISCDMAQGFLFSKPVPIKEFENFF